MALSLLRQARAIANTSKYGAFRRGFNIARSFSSSDYSHEPFYVVPGREPKWMSADEAVSLIRSGRFLLLSSYLHIFHFCTICFDTQDSCDSSKQINQNFLIVYSGDGNKC